MGKWRISPSQRIALGYVAICLLGAFLLLLPFSKKTPLSVVDAVFTSASALFVTGLSSVNTLHAFTPVGDVIIVALVQIGGIGVTFLSTSFYLLIGRKIRLEDRRVLAEERNTPTVGIVRLFRRVVFLVSVLRALALSYLRSTCTCDIATPGPKRSASLLSIASRRLTTLDLISGAIIWKVSRGTRSCCS